MSKYQIIIVSTLAMLLLMANRPAWSRGTAGGGGGAGEGRGGFTGGGGGERGGAERGGPSRQPEPGGTPSSLNRGQQSNHPPGFPSDEGINHGNPSNLNRNNASGASGAAAGAAAANRNSPQYSGAQGAAAGAAAANRNSPQYPGAEGAAAGAAAVNRNSPQYSGVQGAAAGAAVANRNSPQFSGAQGAAAGAAVANRNSPQYTGAEGAVAGAAAVAGYGSGFGYIAPSARYNAATAVRGGYNNYGVYGDEWRVNNPAAWGAAGWGATTAWNSANWNTARSWCGYQNVNPLYYNYGNNVVYQDDNVYVNGTNAGTSAQYYDQVATLANTGALASAPSDGDWLPLGVFALTMAGGTQASATVQIAVNKQSVVRGNYTDADTGTTQSIKGSVDPQTQRLAFTIGDDSSKVIETGLYNLTKDESPALIHLGPDATEQWLLVRLTAPTPPAPNN